MIPSFTRTYVLGLPPELLVEIIRPVKERQAEFPSPEALLDRYSKQTDFTVREDLQRLEIFEKLDKIASDITGQVTSNNQLRVFLNRIKRGPEDLTILLSTYKKKREYLNKKVQALRLRNSKELEELDKDLLRRLSGFIARRMVCTMRIQQLENVREYIDLEQQKP